MAITISKSHIGQASGTNSSLGSGRTLNNNSLFPFKNRLINGDFSVNQISETNATNNTTTRTFPIDRWWFQGSAAAKFSAQIVNDGPDTATQYYASSRPSNQMYSPINFRKCIELKSLANTTLGSTDIYAFGQNIEGRFISDMCFGESPFATTLYFTLSFWVKASQTGIYSVRLQNGPSDRITHRTFNVSAANTWEFVEIVFPVDNTGTWRNTIETGLRVTFNMGIGTSYRGTSGLSSWINSSTELCGTTAVHLVNTLNATIRLTGIQLEFIGQTPSNYYASVFEKRDFTEELGLCLRYFQKSYAYATVPGQSNTIVGMLLNTDMNFSSIQQYNFWRWPGGAMRANPTVKLYSYAGVSAACTLWNEYISPLGSYNAAVAGTSRYGAMFYTSESVSHSLEGFHFEASAEPS